MGSCCNIPGNNSNENNIKIENIHLEGNNELKNGKL